MLFMGMLYFPPFRENTFLVITFELKYTDDDFGF